MSLVCEVRSLLTIYVFKGRLFNHLSEGILCSWDYGSFQTTKPVVK